jgi:TMEM175 potassium channel family protein
MASMGPAPRHGHTTMTPMVIGEQHETDAVKRTARHCGLHVQRCKASWSLVRAQLPQVLTTSDSLRPVLRLRLSSVPPVCAEGEVPMSSSEGFSKSRVEAFSDGVMAVILTIMVLDLRAPRSGEPSALLKLWPSFAIYLVSFFLTTIYWINHHSLMTQARHVTARLLWANSGVLFSASFIPFATAYVGETRLAPFPTAVYGALPCVYGLAFGVMFETIVRQRDDEALFASA